MNTFRVTTAVLCAAVCVAAKSPRQLQQDMAAVVPANTSVRAVWCQGGNFPRPAPNALYAVDSYDGVVRRLTPASPAIKPYHPCITADGARVVFWDENSGRTYAMAWSGQGGYTTVSEEGIFTDYWFDAQAGTHWAIIGGGSVNVERINLDRLSQKVTIYNSQPAAGPDDGLEFDGTYIAAYFENAGPGRALIPTGPITYETNGAGCVMSIAPDGSHRWMHQNSGHWDVQVCSGANACVTMPTAISLDARLPNHSCELSSSATENTRWVQADHVSVYSGSKSANPILVKLLDPTKWVAMQDSLGCAFAGDMDVLFYAPGSLSTRRPVRSSAIAAMVPQCGYALDGRVVSAGAATSAGVTVQAHGNRAMPRLVAR